MTGKTSLFDFSNYKAYLRWRIGEKSHRKGLKSSLAKAIHCHPGFVSQVLNNDLHFNLEQATLLNEFLSHTKEESHFFLLLLQKEKAGHFKLKNYFAAQIEEVLAQRLILTQRLGSQNTMTEANRSIYYSSWQYAAIHIALTIPELQKANALAEYFAMPLRKVNEVLEFLLSANMARRVKDRVVSESSLTRIGNTSHNIIQHHANWRLQAVESLQREDILDLHYSAIVSLSEEDVRKIKETILDQIKNNVNRIRSSQEEKLYAYTIDFFSLKKG